MKITELASLILENCKNPHNRNLKYIKGLISEHLYLREYNNLLKEVEELPNPEEEVPENEPEVVLAEPEEKGIEKGVEPDDLVSLDDEEQEPEEPEATVDTTPEEPIKKIPTPRTGPAAQVEPEVEPKITTISTEQARELLSYKGKIGSAIFKKKDGTRRAMNFMTGVRKFTSGGQLPYSPKEKDVIPVYDLKIGNGPKGYRMLNLPGLESLKINGKQYKIDHSLQNKDKIQEIKINKPLSFTKFPIEINSQQEWEKALHYLDNKGYTWESETSLIKPIRQVKLFPVYLFPRSKNGIQFTQFIPQALKYINHETI